LESFGFDEVDDDPLPPVKLEKSERDFLSLLPSSFRSSLLLLPPEKENDGSLKEDMELSLRMVDNTISYC